MGSLIFLPLILLITIRDSSGNGLFGHCDLSHCNPQLASQFMHDFPPNKETLKAICPSMLESMECHLSAVSECTGQTIEELLASNNATVVDLVTVFISMRNLVQDLCDEDSELSKNYKANANCLKQIIVEHSRKCRQEGGALYLAYIDKLTSLEEIKIDRPSTEVRCLSVAYEVACSLRAVRKKCGQEAMDTYQQILRRLQMFKIGFCSESDILTLKGQFLDFLEEQGEERDFLSAAFEFRK